MKKIITIMFVLLLSSLCYSQISYNQEFQVNTYTEGSQGVPKSTGLIGGGFVICWEGYETDGSDCEIYAQVFDDNGIKIGNEFQVNTYSNDYQRDQSVAGLSNGGFIICWQSMGQDAGFSGIYAQIYDANGVNVGNEFKVNSDTQDLLLKPSAAGVSNGGFIICWMNSGQDGSSWGIYAQMYDENGIKVGNEFLVNTYTNGSQSDQNITGLSNGGFVVCWRSSGQDGWYSGIFAQIYDNNGIKVGNEFQVNTYINNHQKYPSIAGLPNGGFVICWQSKGQDGSSDGIYAQMYDDNGIKFGNEFQTNTYTNDYQWHPSVAGLSNGDFIICWQSYLQAGSFWEIYAQMYDEYGVKLGKEFQVNTYKDHSQNSASAAGLSNGGFIVCWDSYGQDGSGPGVYGKYFLSAPINHNLNSFELLRPELDETMNPNEVKFYWKRTSEIHLNFPWELTYDLYIDKNESFNNPTIYNVIEDTTYLIDSLDTYSTYFWKVLARNIAGDSLWSSDVFGFYTDPNITNVKEIKLLLPKVIELSQNYPNPFNPTTKIKFTIPMGDAFNASATLKIYDILGNEITTLVDEFKQPGTYEVAFDGEGLTSGIYFYKLQVGKYSKTKKMLLMK